MQEKEETMLYRLDIGSIFRFQDDDHGTLYELVDVAVPSDHGDAVWAYADIETGDFVALVVDGRSSGNHVEVQYHGRQP